MLYFAHFFLFISVPKASKEIFVSFAGLKFLHWLQTSCNWSAGFWKQLPALVIGFLYFTVFETGKWLQISVCWPKNRAKEQNFVVCCTLYFVQLTTNILPKRLFWHYNDDDDNDKNQMNLADNLYFILCFNE